jgi:hypothetical protein
MQRPVYPTHVGPNATDEWKQNDCDEGDEWSNVGMYVFKIEPNWYIMLLYFGGNKSQKIQVKSIYMSIL